MVLILGKYIMNVPCGILKNWYGHSNYLCQDKLFPCLAFAALLLINFQQHMRRPIKYLPQFFRVSHSSWRLVFLTGSSYYCSDEILQSTNWPLQRSWYFLDNLGQSQHASLCKHYTTDISSNIPRSVIGECWR